MPALSKSDEFNQTAFNPLTSKPSTPKNNDFDQPDNTKKRNQFPGLSSRNGRLLRFSDFKLKLTNPKPNSTNPFETKP